MEPTDAVLARLDRIGALDRNGAVPGELLAELRGLLREAEGWTRADATARHDAANDAASDAAETTGEVVGRLTRGA